MGVGAARVPAPHTLYLAFAPAATSSAVMRRPLLLPFLLLLGAPSPMAQEAEDGVCTARFTAQDALALEHRFVTILRNAGCRPGDLLHLVFEGPHAPGAAARHCRFDRPVLLDRGTETHLVCVWQGEMRQPRDR